MSTTSETWHDGMGLAPRDRRILVATRNREIYVAHWVKHPETDDEAWLISEDSDGGQHLCWPIAWAAIPDTDHPLLQPISATPEVKP